MKPFGKILALAALLALAGCSVYPSCRKASELKTKVENSTGVVREQNQEELAEMNRRCQDEMAGVGKAQQGTGSREDDAKRLRVIDPNR